MLIQILSFLIYLTFKSLCLSPHIVRVIKSIRLKLASHVARMEGGRNAFKILTGKPTEKRPVGRSRLIWECNIRIDLKEIGISTRNTFNSARDRDYWKSIVNAALKLRVPEAMESI